MAHKKILIIQLRRIGDVILTTPAVEIVRQNFPDAEIDFLVEKPGADILAGNPHISRILVYDKRKTWQWVWKVRESRYDMVIDFLGNPRTAVITYLSGASLTAGVGRNIRRYAYHHVPGAGRERTRVIDFKNNLLQQMGMRVIPALPKIFLSEDEKDVASAWLKEQGHYTGAMRIGIAPASRRWVRKWLPAYYAQTADYASEKLHADVIMLWGPGEEGCIEEVVSSMKSKPIIPPLFNIRRMAGIISCCSAVIANSNGFQHIAEALSVATLTIYGPNDPVSWESGTDKQSYVRAEQVSCIGCNSNSCPYELRCMKEVTPQMVIEAFEKLLKKINVHTGEIVR